MLTALTSQGFNDGLEDFEMGRRVALGGKQRWEGRWIQEGDSTTGGGESERRRERGGLVVVPKVGGERGGERDGFEGGSEGERTHRGRREERVDVGREEGRNVSSLFPPADRWEKKIMTKIATDRRCVA